MSPPWLKRKIPRLYPILGAAWVGHICFLLDKEGLFMVRMPHGEPVRLQTPAKQIQAAGKCLFCRCDDTISVYDETGTKLDLTIATSKDHTMTAVGDDQLYVWSAKEIRRYTALGEMAKITIDAKFYTVNVLPNGAVFLRARAGTIPHRSTYDELERGEPPTQEQGITYTGPKHITEDEQYAVHVDRELVFIGKRQDRAQMVLASIRA